MSSIHSIMKAAAATLGEREVVFDGERPLRVFILWVRPDRMMLHMASAPNGDLIVLKFYGDENNRLGISLGTESEALQVLRGLMNDSTWIEGILKPFDTFGGVPARFGFRTRDLNVRRRSRSARRSLESRRF